MRRFRFFLPALAFILAVGLLGCGAKDLASLAGVAKNDFYVGDRFGNKVKIENPEDFITALKSAKAVKDPKDVKSETEAEYVLYSEDQRIYYDAQGKYLIYLDKGGKKHVYSADLAALLGQINELPPVVSSGFKNDEVSAWLSSFSKVKEPAAILFDLGNQVILAVFGGEKPNAGYSLKLENVSLPNGVLTLDIRLTPPKQGAAQVISYPYAAFTLSKKAEVDVRLVSAGQGGDQVVHVPVAQVASGQNVILLHPERGAILTERVKMSGFARVPEGAFTVEVEDGHNVLGKKAVTAAKGAPEWGYFEFWIDLEQATSPYGTIIFVTKSPKDGSRVEELKVPVSFGGK